jgi:hypothetical protein
MVDRAAAIDHAAAAMYVVLQRWREGVVERCLEGSSAREQYSSCRNQFGGCPVHVRRLKTTAFEFLMD